MAERKYIILRQLAMWELRFSTVAMGGHGAVNAQDCILVVEQIKNTSAMA